MPLSIHDYERKSLNCMTQLQEKQQSNYQESYLCNTQAVSHLT